MKSGSLPSYDMLEKKLLLSMTLFGFYFCVLFGWTKLAPAYECDHHARDAPPNYIEATSPGNFYGPLPPGMSVKESIARDAFVEYLENYETVDCSATHGAHNFIMTSHIYEHFDTEDEEEENSYVFNMSNMQNEKPLFFNIAGVYYKVIDQGRTFELSSEYEAKLHFGVKVIVFGEKTNLMKSIFYFGDGCYKIHQYEAFLKKMDTKPVLDEDNLDGFNVSHETTNKILKTVYFAHPNDMSFD